MSMGDFFWGGPALRQHDRSARPWCGGFLGCIQIPWLSVTTEGVYKKKTCDTKSTLAQQKPCGWLVVAHGYFLKVSKQFDWYTKNMWIFATMAVMQDVQNECLILCSFFRCRVCTLQIRRVHFERKMWVAMMIHLPLNEWEHFSLWTTSMFVIASAWTPESHDTRDTIHF